MKKADLSSPIRQTMLAVRVVGSIGCALLAGLHGLSGDDWLLSTSIAFGITAYHMLLRFLAPVILHVFFHRRYNADSRWFRQKSWETGLYHFLHVKAWKSHMMTYDPSQFSLKKYSMEQILQNMCHAELIHELNIILSFSSLLFAIPFGSFPVFLITALLAALFDGIFVIIQRYNRPRIAAIIQHSHRSV